MRSVLALVLAISLILLQSCSSHSVQDYSDRMPVLELEEFFNGNLSAHGVIKNRRGEVIRTFNAEIKAWWEEGIGYLDEDFIFDDGEKQKRVWKLVKDEEGRYEATAGDVIGTGLGLVSGNAFNLEYILEIDYKDSKLEISVDDWMWLVDENTIINHSKMKKFGFRVGEIQLVILKNN